MITKDARLLVVSTTRQKLQMLSVTGVKKTRNNCVHRQGARSQPILTTKVFAPGVTPGTMHCCNKSRPWLGHPHPHPVSARLRVVRNQETLNCITCVFDVICGILKRWGQRFQLVGHLLTGLQVNHNCPDHPLWLHLMKIFHRNKSQMKKPLGERWWQQRGHPDTQDFSSSISVLRKPKLPQPSSRLC